MTACIIALAPPFRFCCVNTLENLFNFFWSALDDAERLEVCISTCDTILTWCWEQHGAQKLERKAKGITGEPRTRERAARGGCARAESGTEVKNAAVLSVPRRYWAASSAAAK